MKKLILSLAALLIVAVGFAQGPKGMKPRKGPEQKARKITDWMKKELNLTSEQESKIYQMNLESLKLLKAVKADSSMDDAAKKARRKEIRKARFDQYKTVLTPEQITTLKAKAKEHKAAKQQNPPGKKANPNKGPKGELSDDDIDDLVE